MAQNTQAQTEFNDAFGTIGRANILWQKCHADRMVTDMASYVDTLLCLYAELESEIKKDDSHRIRKLLFVSKDAITQIMRQPRKRVFSPNLYHDLFSIELDLRRVWDEKGYKTKRAQDPRSALGGD